MGGQVRRAAAALAVVALTAVTACAQPPVGDGSAGGSLRWASTAPRPVAPATEPPDPGASRVARLQGPGGQAKGPVRVVMAGDVLLHNGLWEVAAADAARGGQPVGSLDFRPLLAGLRPLVSGADLAVCHLETPLARPSGPFRNYPLFSAPPQVVPALAATGFDACTTASNHSVDQGYDGLRRTLHALDLTGMRHVGTARSRSEQHRPTIVDVEGVRVGLLSYTYGTNGMPVDADKPWSVNLIDPQQIRRDARRTKAAGADAVLVALHWGDEYRHEPSSYQWAVARAVTRSGDVDLVYGHHAHVVQPVRRVNGTWVAFGLGNLVAQQDPSITGVYEGLVPVFDLTVRPGGAVAVDYVGYRPVFVSRYGGASHPMRVYDIDSELRRARLPSGLLADMALARKRVADVVGP